MRYCNVAFIDFLYKDLRGLFNFIGLVEGGSDSANVDRWPSGPLEDEGEGVGRS